MTTFSADGEPQGLTVNSFTSVSLAPPLVLFCIDLESQSAQHFERAESFAVHVLREESRELSDRFAFAKGERFAGISWSRGAQGAPILEAALAVLECRKREWIVAGDHAIVVGEAVGLAEGEAGAPLVYFRGAYRQIKED